MSTAAAHRRAPSAGGAPPAPLYLHPGQVAASAAPAVVSTILGSCVAVCLHDPMRGIGGVNHFLLPHQPGGAQASARFGGVAMEELLARVLALGASRAALVAKVFGGACVLDAFGAGPEHLGARNAEVAMAFLERHGIPVAARDTGGRRGRRLHFHTDDGTALVRLI